MGIGSFYIPLGVYIVGIIVAFLTVFVRKELGLIYLILLIPLQNLKQKLHVFPLGQNFFDILVLGLIIAWFFRSKDKDNKIFEKTAANIPILLYIIITFVGLLVGSSFLGVDVLSYEGQWLSDWKNLIMLPILYLIAVNNVKDLKWMKVILLAAMVSIFFTDISFYREFRWYKSFYYTNDMRVNGPFAYLGPNELGAFFAQYGVLVFSMFLFAEKYRERLLIGLLLICNLYCLMYSFSRAAYLAFPIGLAFILFFKSKRLLVVFLILVALAPRLLPVSVMERIEMTMLSEEEKIERESSDVGNRSSVDEPMFDSSAQGRLDIWEDALEMFKSSPIFGVGFHTFGHLKNIDTHNNFLKILAELGAVGFAVYIFLYYLAFRSGWQLYRESNDRYLKGLGLGFASCVIANMIVNLTHDNWTYFNLMGFYWIFWGLVERSKIMIKKSA